MIKEVLSNSSVDFLPDTSKITHPTIHGIAQEYTDSGVPERVAEIFHGVPAVLQQPVHYTFARHVTKERPLSIVHIADEIGVEREKSCGIAAGIDVLWNVGIIVDDIYDKDATNALQEPSAWSQFGKAAAFAASATAVTATVTYTARRYGPKAAYELSQQLRKGIASLTQSRNLSLESPLDDYFYNYDLRSGFYTVSPIAAIGKYSSASREQITGAQLSLARMNRAGQMINDLQDFDESADRSRSDSFSDIRNRVASIPIRHIWRAIDGATRDRFAKLHGRETLTASDENFLRKLVQDTGMAAATLQLIKGEYATARDEYIEALSPSQTTLHWVDNWLNYKHEQAEKVAATLEKPSRKLTNRPSAILLLCKTR